MKNGLRAIHFIATHSTGSSTRGRRFGELLNKISSEEFARDSKSTSHAGQQLSFLRFFLVFLVMAIWFLPKTSFAGKRYSVATGNWNATTTWSASSGGASGATIPTATDSVYISESSAIYTITIPSAYAASCKAIFIGNNSFANTATLTLAAATSSLAVDNVIIYAPTGSATRTLDVNAGSVTVSGDVSLSNGISGNQVGKVSKITVPTGTLTVGGNVIFNANSNAQSTIDLSGGGTGSGTLNIGGNLTLVNNQGTLTPAPSSKVVFIGAANQALSLISNSAISYSNIEVNKPSGIVSLTGTITINGSVTLTQGTLNTNGYLILIYGDWVNNGGALTYINNGAEYIMFTGAGSTISGTTSTTFPILMPVGTTSVTMQNSNTCTALQMLATAVGTSFTQTAGANLTVNGDVTISQPSGAVTNAWNINAGTATVTGNINIGGTSTTATRLSKIAITTGTLNANNIVYNSAASTPATAVIDMSGGAGLMNLSGNITLTNNSGTLTPGTTSTVNFNGTAAQAINTLSAIKYNNVYINNNAGVTANTNITATIATGDIRVQTGILNNGGFAIAGAGTKTFEVANGATFNLSGTSAMVTGFGAKTFEATSTVNYNGSSQTVSAETYGHLIFSGSGTKTMPGSAMTIAGNFTTTGTIVTTAANATTIAGNVTLGAGTTFNAGSATHSVAGNWTNNGATFTSGTSTVSFNGTTDQNITSTAAFNNINVNKTAGTITLSGDLTATGVSFTKGLITTGTNKVIVSSAGSVSGASQSTGWVYGNLQRYFSGSALTGTFDVGGSNYYNPLSMTFAGITAAGGITAAYTEVTHPNLSASGILYSKSIPGYWTITNSGAVAFSTYDVGLTWNSALNYTNLNSTYLKAGEYTTLSWTYPTVGGTPTTTNVHASGITTFGDFVVGESCNAGMWTGAVGTLWNVAANWECGVVPDNTTNVIIPSSLFNYPVITVLTPEIKNLTLQSGATVTVTNGTFKIKGTITNSGGSINATAGKIELTGTTAQTIPANLFYSNIVKDLVVTNPAGVTLAGALRITNSVGFGNVNNSVLTTGGFLTLVSTSSNTANVLDITNAGLDSGNNISGLVTVERYVQGKRSYRFLTAPVNSPTSMKANWMENTNNTSTTVNNNPTPGYGTHITGLGGSGNGFDATGTNNPSIFNFSQAGQAWSAVPNTSGVFTAGNGYRIMVRGSRSADLNNNSAPPSTTTLRATGNLVTGTVTMTKAGGGGTTGMPQLTAVTGNYSFVANPYASVVNWLLLDKTDVSSSIYIYDPTVSGSNGRGAYVAYNGAQNVNSYVGSLINNYIQSGQAFFVETTGPNPSFTFKESYKASSFSPVFRSAASEIANLSVELLLPPQQGTSSAADGVRVSFSDDYSPGIGDEDSYKFTNMDENIGVLKNGKILSIEGRKTVNSTDTVQLKVWQLSQSSYTLKVSFENFPSNVEGYLEDAYLRTSTPLNANSETLVPFTITSEAASVATDRFKIVFETLATLPVRLTGIKAYTKNKGVQVEWVAESESNMDVYEVQRSADAQQFETIGSAKAKNNPGIAAAYNFFDANPVAGDDYYRIKSVEKSGDVKLSEVVRVQIPNEKNAISVTNNPVDGKTIKLLFDNVQKGSYVVRLINNSGQAVYAGQISYAGGNVSQQLNLNNRLPAGIYQLHLTNGTLNKTVQVLVK